MTDSAPETALVTPRFEEAVGLWLKVGVISFGGPAAQIAILHEELVHRRRWVSETTFLTALNYCMLLPGPEAQQLATYMGLKLHGVRGALAAGVLFVLPGAGVLFALAWLAAAHGNWPPLQAAFKGVLPIVVALVAQAVWRIGGRTLKTPAAWIAAVGAFIGLGLLKIAFPWIIAAALVLGLVADRLQHGPGAPDPSAAPEAPLDWRRHAVRLAGLSGLFAALWAAPVALVLTLFGAHPFAEVAGFFTKAAFVTFGGAYAVLPYVAQAAVDHYGWLSRTEMVHGLALAETTPGPLILVTQYVGFFAGWNAAGRGMAGGLSPLAAGGISAALTTWVTFLPCFYFVLAGAPLVDRLANNRRAHAALSGVTSAVVGVIATLALLVAREAFAPGGRLDPIAIVLAVVALIAAIRFKVGPLWLVAVGAGLGILRGVAGI
ncbi:MAG: chromate efflux transporter [Caulobacteraceae bacterium]|nr:chromate efflux transporter [Caulobacteraceae bacterium]